MIAERNQYVDTPIEQRTATKSVKMNSDLSEN